jgi:hypothetical protein
MKHPVGSKEHNNALDLSTMLVLRETCVNQLMVFVNVGTQLSQLLAVSDQ